MDRRHAVGGDPAQPAPPRPHPVDRHRPGGGPARRLRGAHPRGRARPQDLRARTPRPAGPRHRRGALPRRAGRHRGRRPSRDGQARPQGHRGRLRAARTRWPTPGGPATTALRNSTRTATCSSTSASAGATSPRSRRRPRSWSPATTRWACKIRPSSGSSPGWPCRPTTVGSTSTSPPNGCTSTASRSRLSLGMPEDKVRLHLAGVGGAFGAREDLSMQIHASLLALQDRTAGPHGLQPRGVVLRPRPSAPGVPALRARRRRRRPAGVRPGRDRPRRRRLRLELAGGGGQRGDAGRRSLRGRRRRDRQLGRLHQQSAVRSDARLRRGAGVLRLRGPDGSAGRPPRSRPDRAADPQRHVRGLDDADRSGRSTRPRRWPSC